MFQLRLQMPGLDAQSTAIRNFAGAVTDWGPFWTDRFGPAFYEATQANFETAGAASGAPWAPLSPTYAAWKAKRFPGAPILVRSGALRQSLAGPRASGYSIFRPTSTSLEIGSAVPYGIYHQMGAHWTRMTSHNERIGMAIVLPQRPPLRVSKAFMVTVGKLMQQHLAWVRRTAHVTLAEVSSPVQPGLFGGGLL